MEEAQIGLSGATGPLLQGSDDGDALCGKEALKTACTTFLNFPSSLHLEKRGDCVVGL